MTRHAMRWASSGKRAGTKAVKRWQFVSFAGPAGAESRGIVDLIAIRRDHRPSPRGFPIGDLFEIILVQIKGGSAPFPTLEELERLRAVKRVYRAKAVVLASWKKGGAARFFVLERVARTRQTSWRAAHALEIFGSGPPRGLR